MNLNVFESPRLHLCGGSCPYVWKALRMDDQRVRQYIFERLIAGEQVPRVAGIAAALRTKTFDVVASLRRMHEAHILVVDAASEIIMANPFSAVPTAFAVQSGAKSWFGNCIWDALGILAMLGADGRVHTTCADCSEPMILEIQNARLLPQRALVHFALPVKQWWKNIVFT